MIHKKITYLFYIYSIHIIRGFVFNNIFNYITLDRIRVDF